ncbi:hypothetical protein GCM10009840_18130 [Pseudolysinimonas kribbensis]|uniref:Uncharacterized protein n=1 Tax=Pseudolysinimonas kribbensis TaxID=433641 RepID=A0ABQ6K2Z0_9MICO|nr:hypothetical protein [Pseudolysinimonas kribbensis]GMA93804.1 hypothetical protein GCM10025881_06280 [Pseudolysinimonas kribbensis]
MTAQDELVRLHAALAGFAEVQAELTERLVAFEKLHGFADDPQTIYEMEAHAAAQSTAQLVGALSAVGNAVLFLLNAERERLS